MLMRPSKTLKNLNGLVKLANAPRAQLALSMFFILFLRYYQPIIQPHALAFVLLQLAAVVLYKLKAS